MKKLISMLLVLVLTLSAAVSVSAFEPAGYPASAEEAEVLLLTNRERLRDHRHPLTMIDPLQQVGDIRAEELSRQFSHTRPDGSSCFSVIGEVGLDTYQALAENIAQGHASPAAVVDGWMHSDGHRENLLSSDYAHIGVGYDPASRSWVQFFYAGWGCSYQDLKLIVPQNIPAGTAIDDMGVWAEMTCSFCGKAYLPVMEEFCSGYQPDVTTEQTVTVTLFGMTASFTLGEKAPEPEKFDLEGTSMLLGNSLQMNFYVSKADLSDTAGAYAVVTKSFADNREDLTVKIPAAQWSENAKSYKIPFTGIAAKEMTDPVTVEVFSADGTALSTVHTDTIRDYALRTLGNPQTDRKLKTLLVDMLNYGAACQTYFNYNQNNPANAGAEDYQQFASPAVDTADHRVKGPNFVGTTLKTENNLLMTFYFQNVTTDMNAVIRFTDHYSHSKEITVSGADFRFKDGNAVIDVAQLAMADIRQPVTCEIFSASGDLVASVTDSIESYIARADADAVFTSIMKFGASAYTHFHPNQA